MPSLFDQTIFNGEVFGQYIDQIPYAHLNELIKSSAIVVNNSVKTAMSEQTGGFIMTTPIKGSIMDAIPDNYDGNTNLTTDSQASYAQSRVVVGRGHGFTEKDFVTDITGGYEPLENAGNQVGAWKDRVRENILYAILAGAFGMNDTAGAAFVNKHTHNVTAVANSENVTGKMDATTLNTAMQKACGDHKRKFALAIMHSQVATNLENLGLLTYIKYNDANGMQRDTDFATLNGRLVLVDDDVPTMEDESTATFAKTSDVALVTGKTYYTRSGSAGSYVYTAVAEPDVSDIGSYYEKTAMGNIIYTTYIFGAGAIEYTDCGAKNPYTVSRDESKNGGEETLWVRMRDCFAPYGISFNGSNIASLSPTLAELRNGSNWNLVSTGGTNKQYIDDKAIPIARVLSLG